MNKEYTLAQLDEIVALHDSGMSFPHVAEEMNRKHKFGKNGDAMRAAYRRRIKAEKKVLAKPRPKKRLLPEFGDIHREVSNKNERVLFISDLHVPYHHPDTFAFLEAVKKKYKPTRVVSVGDECFTEATEILVKDRGWISIKDVTVDDLVMAYLPDGTGAFVKPSRKINRQFDGDLVRRANGSFRTLTTPNHELVLDHPKHGLIKQPAHLDRYSHANIPRNLEWEASGIGLNDNQIRLAVALQADFTLRQTGDWYGCLKKARKIERLRDLLNACGIRYSDNEDGRGYRSFFIHRSNDLDYCSKRFSARWLFEMSKEQKLLFLNELTHWDGYDDPTRNRTIYCSSDMHNISFVQTMAHTTGVTASTRQVNSEFGISYQVSLLWDSAPTRLGKRIEQVPYSGSVYCVTVPSGMLLTKFEGSICVVGNCDKHALSFHDSDPDLPSAGDELREAIKHLKVLYKMFPNVDLVDSNHGSMVYRKGKHSGIPRKYLRDYGEVLEAPKGWIWSHDLTLELPDGNELYVHHGLSKDIMKVVNQRGMCAVSGHYHTEFRIGYSGNPNALLWGMNVGCSIDGKALAFAYDRNNLGRPIIGHGIVIDSLPKLLPMILDEDGRWIGVVP